MVIADKVTDEPLNAVDETLDGLLPSQHTNVSELIAPNAYWLIVVTDAGIRTLVRAAL